MLLLRLEQAMLLLLLLLLQPDIVPKIQGFLGGTSFLCDILMELVELLLQMLLLVDAALQTTAERDLFVFVVVV